MSAPLNVLFLCTGNSARSVLAESVLNREGGGRFRAYSAGSQPRGSVHPLAILVLDEADYPIGGLRSKSWDEFAAPGAPHMDVIVTVCDNAAGEACPVWPGKPVTAHWGIADPAAVEGSETERKQAFRTALAKMRHRIGALLDLPSAGLDRPALGRELQAIGARADRAGQ